MALAVFAVSVSAALVLGALIGSAYEARSITNEVRRSASPEALAEVMAAIERTRISFDRRQV